MSLTRLQADVRVAFNLLRAEERPAIVCLTSVILDCLALCWPTETWLLCNLTLHSWGRAIEMRWPGGLSCTIGKNHVRLDHAMPDAVLEVTHHMPCELKITERDWTTEDMRRIRVTFIDVFERYIDARRLGQWPAGFAFNPGTLPDGVFTRCV